MFNLQTRSEENTNTKPQTVQTTKNYARFKLLQGNRDLIEGNIKAVMNQISAFGQRQPIIINERNEIIDGQHRLEACRRLGLAVKYIVDAGARIDHVISANIVGKKWSMLDYIKRFVAEGNEHYVKLYEFMVEAKSAGIPSSSALQIVRQGHRDRTYYMYDDGKVRIHGGSNKAKRLYAVGNDMNLGQFTMPNKKGVQERFESVLAFRAFPFYKHGRFIQALLQVMRITDFDVKRLAKQAEKYPSRFTNEPDTDSFVRMFESVYNYRSSKKLPLVNHPERRK